MIVANQWYNVAKTISAGSKTGIRLDMGIYYALLMVTVDYGSAGITTIESNISPDIFKLAARIRYNSGAWYADVRISTKQDATLTAALYNNTGWSSVEVNTSTSGNTICIINDVISQMRPSSGGGESLWQLINTGTEDNPAYTVFPKDFNGKIVHVASYGDVISGGLKSDGTPGDGSTSSGSTVVVIPLLAEGSDTTPIATIQVDGVPYGIYAPKAPEVDLTGYAKESYVNTAIANLINAAPETLDTLGEIATQIQANIGVLDVLSQSVITNKASIEQLQQKLEDLGLSIEVVNGVTFLKSKHSFFSEGEVASGGLPDSEGGGTGGSGGSVVVYTPILTEGKHIGTIQIDGVQQEIYAPEGDVKKEDLEKLVSKEELYEEGGTIIKKSLLPTLNAGKGVTIDKSSLLVSMKVNTDTFGFSEDGELELLTVDGGLI